MLLNKCHNVYTSRKCGKKSNSSIDRHIGRQIVYTYTSPQIAENGEKIVILIERKLSVSYESSRIPGPCDWNRNPCARAVDSLASVITVEAAISANQKTNRRTKPNASHKECKYLDVHSDGRDLQGFLFQSHCERAIGLVARCIPSLHIYTKQLRP